MVGTSGRILRSEDVILEGQCLLDAGRTEIAGAEPQPKSTVSAPARVCILENHPEYAVFEVTCACGTKMCLRCEYASSQMPNNSQMRDDAAVEPGQVK
jgi:hypothetical protein